MDTLPVPEAGFDYRSLDPAARAVALEAAAKIRLHGRRAAESIVAIGEELARPKARLGHGEFLAWLEAEFAWTDRHAHRFMAVAEWAKSDNLSDAVGEIDVSALYLLASPSTPEAVREVAVERARAGERVTHASVKDEVERHKRKVAEAFAPGADEPPLPFDPAERPRRRVEEAAFDPAKRRAFDLTSELVGSFKLFTALEHDPGEVARSVWPLSRRRYLAHAEKVRDWLDRFCHAMREVLRDAA